MSKPKEELKGHMGRVLNAYDTRVKAQMNRIDKQNKTQDFRINVLSNEGVQGIVSDGGNDISLDYSLEGMVFVDKIIGNTIVNRSNTIEITPLTLDIGSDIASISVSSDDIHALRFSLEGNTYVNRVIPGQCEEEIVLSGLIDKQGKEITLTEGVDGSRVDIEIDGHTVHNLSSIKDSTPVTHKFDDIVNSNRGVLEGAIEGTCEVGQIVGDTLVNLICAEDVPEPGEVITLNDYINETNYSPISIVDKTVQGAEIEVLPQGNSLINLFDFNKKNYLFGNNTENSLYQIDVYKETKAYIGYNFAIGYKANTTYTLIFDIIEQTGASTFQWRPVILSQPYFVFTNLDDSSKIPEGYTGKIIAKMTTTSELLESDITTNNKGLRIGFDTGDSGGTLKINNIILLEGDHTANPPEYFEGIQSAYEEHKSKKNLFDGQLEKGSIYRDNGGDLNISAGYEDYTKTRIRSKYIECKSNTAYTLSNASILNVHFYNANKEWIQGINLEGNSITYNTTNETAFIRFVCEATSLTQFPNIQLEEGTIATPYVPYGKYKVEVKTTGKNLISSIEACPNVTVLSNSSVAFNYDLSLDDSYFVINTQSTLVSGKFYTVSFDVEGISNSEVLKVGINSQSENIINITSNGSYSKTFILSKNSSKILIDDISKSTTKIMFSNIMLVEGDTATEYEPYKEDVKTVYINEPLRAIGDVKDRIIKKDGKWVVERNCGEVVLNNCVGRYTGQDTNNVICCISEVIPNLLKSCVLICDKIPHLNYWNYDGEVISADSYNGGVRFFIKINKSKLPTQDVQGFNQWLSENPITVIYQLATPIYEELDGTLLMDTFNDVTHVYDNSEVIPNKMEIKSRVFDIQSLKPSNVYTIVVNSDKSNLAVGMGGGSSIKLTQNNKLVYTTPTGIYNNLLYFTNSKGTKIHDLMLLEGEVPDELIPDKTFEGICSSYEEHKSKNLLNVPQTWSRELHWNGQNNCVLVGYAKIEPNTNYTIGGNYFKSTQIDGNGGWGIYTFKEIPPQTGAWFLTQDTNWKDKIGSSYQHEWHISVLQYTFNSGDYTYVGVYVGVATSNSANHIATITNLQLEEGEVATEYEPYGYKAEVKTYETISANDILAKLQGGAN